MKSGDIQTRLITELPEGHKLYRCENESDCSYSYITDKVGFEIMSNPTEREADMLRSFFEYVVRQQADEDLISKAASAEGKEVIIKI